MYNSYPFNNLKLNCLGLLKPGGAVVEGTAGNTGEYSSLTCGLLAFMNWHLKSCNCFDHGCT